MLQFYARRWGIESLFQNLKRWWGANHLWQQSRRVLELWMQVRSTGYALMQLLALQPARGLPVRRGRPVAQAPSRRHRRTLRRLDAPPFFRCCVSPRLRPQVRDIHLSRAPRRPACTTRPCLNRPRGAAFGRSASFAAFFPSLQSPGEERVCLNPSLFRTRARSCRRDARLPPHDARMSKPVFLMLAPFSSEGASSKSGAVQTGQTDGT